MQPNALYSYGFMKNSQMSESYKPHGFPTSKLYRDRQSGELKRHHLHKTVLQRAVKEAVREVRIAKLASCHTFRHSFATHLREDR